MNPRKRGRGNITEGDSLEHNAFPRLACGMEFFGCSESVNARIDLFCVRWDEQKVPVLALCPHVRAHLFLHVCRPHLAQGHLLRSPWATQLIIFQMKLPAGTAGTGWNRIVSLATRELAVFPWHSSYVSLPVRKRRNLREIWKVALTRQPCFYALKVDAWTVTASPNQLVHLG